ncbi:MAG: hypothetical protein ACK4SX_05290 [Alcanivoracaceae bacterium]
MADVTSLVQSKGNGTYSFSDLTVTNTDISTTQRYCNFGVVYSGWSLVVVFEHPSEPFRVVNFYDGLQTFYGSQITLVPDNLRIPASPINGKLAVLTFEGDAAISTARNGFTESVRVNNNLLVDGLNPANNQYNDTINTLGVNNSWGVDLDVYNIGSFLSAGDTSITTQYSSGGDWVQLMLQVVSATSDPVSDLSIRKRRNGVLQAGGMGQYRISVRNNGPLTEPGPIQVTDTLNMNLGYTGYTGSGWNCSAAGQNVTCTHSGPLANGAELPELFINVSVAASAAGQSISNTATVSGQNFDNISANDSDTTTDFIYGPIPGLKRLYPFFQNAQGVPANSLSRVLPTTNTTSGTFGPGGSRTLILNPSLARPLDIVGSANPIPVRICSRRQGTGNSNNRSMRVSLAYTIGVTTTLIGTPQTVNFSADAWTLRTLGFVQPADLTLPAGATLRVVIENTTPAGAGTRLIEASSLSCGALDVSRAELNIGQVINVEEVAAHSVAFPASNPVTSVIDNGNTLFVRALISDPFGSFDITSAVFDLFDEDNNLVSGPLTMNLVNDDVATGQRTYEISGVIPSWTGSPYTLRVQGNEGSETGANAIFSFGGTSLQVSPQPPFLLLTKLASSPSASPGSVVSYTIQVSNAGTGDATGVEIADALPRFLSLGINTFGPGQAVQFVDGSPSSGLTPGAPQFSNDNGTTFIYAPVSAGGGAPAGFDRNITNFRQPFSGLMPPGSSFILNYDAIVD